MQFRVAFLVRTTEELIDKLGHFLSGFTNEPTTGICYRQNEKQTHESVEELLAQGKVNKIAQLWVGGFDFDWETIYDLETKPHRISLPSYPFLKQRFWIGESLTSSVPAKPESSEKITSSVSFQAESEISEKIAKKVETEDDLANRKALSPLLLELAEAPEKEQEEMISAVLQKKGGLPIRIFFRLPATT
jgi:acyl transferase domain-containing protein